MAHSSADACINILYRLGCRDIFLYGVQLHGGGRCRTGISEPAAACADPAWARAASDAILSARKALPVTLYSGTRDSMLVSEGVCSYRELS
jgi:hypothetical protein